MMIDRNEAIRLLGFRHADPDEKTQLLIEECEVELQRESQPLYRALLCPANIQASLVRVGELAITSTALARHMEGCNEMILFAATLGAGPDRLMQRLMHTNIAKAFVMQACAAAALETYADEMQSGLPALLARPHRYMTARFSPGYGDFSLSIQPELLRLMDTHRKIALSCTEQNMLTPTKSITALIGLCDHPVCHVDKCTACTKIDCAYKRSNE